MQELEFGSPNSKTILNPSDQYTMIFKHFKCAYVDATWGHRGIHVLKTDITSCLM